MDYKSRQTLILLLLKSFHDLYPEIKVIIEHSYGPGVYCRYYPAHRKINYAKIEKKIREHIRRKIKIEEIRISRKKLSHNFATRDDLLGLLDSKKRFFQCYKIENFITHLSEPAVLSTDQIGAFKLITQAPGFVISWGDFEPRPQLFNMIEEYEAWAQILGVFDICRLNKAIKERFDTLILLAEALHERKIAYITDEIIKKKKRLILIAGPSASGKTTFSKRLSIQLLVAKIRPVALSLDDYFFDRSLTPKGPDGSPNYECIEAVNTRRLNRDILKLLKGREIRLPKFNFITGKSEFRGRVEKLDKSDVLILEGIHGLNEKLTYAIGSKVKFKIYASAITQLNIDNHNRIHTRDTRLLRRMVRDAQFRNHSPAETIKTWSKVTSGEDRNIFPFQEEADIMFNSALIYELPILAKFAKPLLRNIRKQKTIQKEKNRLLDLLSYFNTAQSSVIPNNSILREFIGGSVFLY